VGTLSRAVRTTDALHRTPSPGWPGNFTEIMAIYQLGEHAPDIAPSAYITDSASIVGRVRIEENTSVWFGVTVRGDNEDIHIGKNCNLQEGAVLHADPGFPLTLADNVSIGHQAMVHGCTVGEGSLIGIQAVILNGAKIGRNCLVGAGALITEGKEFPDNSLIVGAPARVVRTLTEEDIARLARIADGYVRRSRDFRNTLKRIG
jgi:carbonic anhydrase/acetyltransferase-like protein (isoleucine patch superfamily)